jgi:hypothetical protein
MALEVSNRRLLSLFTFLAAVLLGASSAVMGVCGPFTDVSDAAFCPFVLEIFTLGITTGTTPTTYDPASSVSRLQMAAFLSRSVDGVLKRGSRRAAADKFYTPQDISLVGLTTIGGSLALPRFDGLDIWVPSNSGTVSRVRAGDGRLLETWTTPGASPFGVSVAMGRIVVSAGLGPNPGKIFTIDPAQAAGAATLVASTLGSGPLAIAFDGSRFWTANFGGSVSIVTPQPAIPWSVSNVNVTVGSPAPVGIVFDGSNIWTTDANASTITRLSSVGSILQTVTVGAAPYNPAFDGANIWVPNNFSNSVTVMRASTGAILQTLTGNGLNFPYAAGFDGERVLITNETGDSVSLWKAADLTPLGSSGMGALSHPRGVCSDGLNFWITLGSAGKLARF